MWVWIVAAAWANDVEILRTPSGMVQGSVQVAAAPREVSALLTDPERLGSVIGNGSTVTSVREGPCDKVTTYTPHAVMPVTYVARGCPTATGYESRLLESRQLSEFYSLWRVEPGPQGATIRYSLRVRSSLPLPALIVRRSARNGVVDSLTALRAHFGAAATP